MSNLGNPPWIALTAGDPAGIGPELLVAALEHARRESEGTSELAYRLLALGPANLRPAWVSRLEEATSATLEGHREPVWLDTSGPDGEALEPWEPARVQAAAGRAALGALRCGHDLAMAGVVEALVTGPVNKEAMHLAGERVEGQTELLARWAQAPRTQMMAVAGRLRVLLLTRHLPLADALGKVTRENVVEHLLLLRDSLEELGIAQPRVALAGLNPHAGEAGLLGSEEGRVLEPAAEQARQLGVQVAGPISPDSVFQQASRGDHDGVLALYHDQAFIPVKLLDPDGGLTVLCGLPYLRVSPAHGTAFDIVGTGKARPGSLLLALDQAAQWARARRKRRP